MNNIDFKLINIQPIHSAWLTSKDLELHVLRLDKIHDVISGNKWFKLKFHLEEAIASQKNTIATFGGAWSNHIIATAFAAKSAGLKSVGIIRGEQPGNFSETLLQAQSYGMELIFVSRENYRNKEKIKEELNRENWYWVNEGGYGITGAKGAAQILNCVDGLHSYTHIVAAVGTGTMLAGIISAAENQQIIGISSLKGNTALENEINNLLPENKKGKFEILHQYHFGGYGKHPKELIDFINEVYHLHQLPLDIVYTAKTFFAIQDLSGKNYFTPGSKILMIHSGGLQGNRSLPAGLLAF